MIDWEIIIAIIGVVLGIINFWYTTKRTKKTESEKLEEFRHKLILRTQNLILELERKYAKLNQLYQKFENVKLKLNFQEIINSIADLKLSGENVLEYFNGIKLGLEDKDDYNTLEKLRRADVALNKYEKQYEEFNLVFDETIQISSQIDPSLLDK